MKSLLPEGRYYGSCNTLRKVGPLVLTECVYPPGLQIPRHAHENPYFIFALRGGQEESFGTRNRTYVSGTLAFHPRGESHSEKVGSTGMRCLHVEFSPQWIERHAEISRFLEEGSHVDGGQTNWLARRVHQEFCCPDDVAPIAIEGLVLEILAESFRLARLDLSGARPPWLLQARDLIHAHFSEPLSLADVAVAVDVHPVRLARAFRTEYRCSVGEFIRQLRIQSACQAIHSGQARLSDVGLAAGFADQAHFCRAFKRVTGMTPGQFANTSAVQSK